MEPHEKLKVISVLKKSHKNFTSTDLGLTVDQIYPYIAASLELLVTCHCCENGVVEIKFSYSVCESFPSEENVFRRNYLMDKQNLINLKNNHN